MKIILLLTFCVAVLLTGCSAAWISTVDSILAVAAPALIDILQIVAVANDQPLNRGLAAKINTDASAIKLLAGDFAKASSASSSGICQQLETAISTYQADQQLVLQVAQVSDTNTQTKITLLADLVAGTVQAIMAVIPSCQNAPSAHDHKGQPPLKLRDFVTEYNAILKSKTGNTAVDAITPKLAIHQHSKIERAITFGRLQ
ncbi:MAG TPA: hypothetical protein VK828_04425 [Terriglobales bacterium]|jgi:hypothetical protein|nr:hypothetical protein [Terriglobales bacterium]